MSLIDHFDELENSLWNDKCDYIKRDKCKNLKPNDYNLIVLQLNIRSILSHPTELKQLLRALEKKHSRVDAVLSFETFSNSKTYNLVNVPGYNHICNYRKIAKAEEFQFSLTVVYHIKGTRI